MIYEYQYVNLEVDVCVNNMKSYFSDHVLYIKAEPKPIKKVKQQQQQEPW